ncbi:VOC family protein [Klebsiella aerogenes]|uniref:VOC family protein n=1 Tax=Klebsiella aerogenes TaxID=548 RepID=UPI001F19D155|nr:VOC family protein [Klebsiella aerogenes]
MSLTPYLFFAGNCTEAIAFYERAINADILRKTTRTDTCATEGETPESATTSDPSSATVTNALLRIGVSEIMLADGTESTIQYSGFILSLIAADKEEGRRWFYALADGGSILTEWQETDELGMLKDKFGISWIIHTTWQR